MKSVPNPSLTGSEPVQEREAAVSSVCLCLIKTKLAGWQEWDTVARLESRSIFFPCLKYWVLDWGDTPVSYCLQVDLGVRFVRYRLWILVKSLYASEMTSRLSY